MVAQLIGVAFQAGRALLHGPWGIGKTTILLEVARNAREAGLSVGYCVRTRSLGDVVDALEHAYGTAGAAGLSAKQRKSVLRLAAERESGLLILDGLEAGGSALVGFMRSLRGKQLAVIAAADVEHPRDLAAARASGVAYRELAIPLLPVRELSKFLEQLLQRQPLPCTLSGADRLALLNLAAGRPGVLERAWARLGQQRYWRGTFPLLETLRADIHLEWLAETSPVAVAGRPN
ncbi:MAG TPA: ATP-binding protein [Polyangia bacterium]|nr:ATP-binding protein [Polyangia bacterium]